MGALDRFRRLEKVRRENASDAPPPEQTLDRFREPPPPLAPEDAPYQTKPCLACGAENGALAKLCFQCDADLDTPAMRAHRAAQRERERAQREQAAAAQADRERREQEELERFRAERERRIEQMRQPDDVGEMADDLQWSRPLIAILQLTSRIRNPWLRAAVQIALVGGFAAAVIWTLYSPGRYPLMLLLLVLIGIVPGWRRRRWWR
jgi:hypothetical protein